MVRIAQEGWSHLLRSLKHTLMSVQELPPSPSRRWPTYEPRRTSETSHRLGCHRKLIDLQCCSTILCATQSFVRRFDRLPSADAFSVYLTGATLFLSLILARVFYIILDFINVQEKYSALQQRTAKESGANGESEEMRKRITELEAELKTSQSKDRDFGESGEIRTALPQAEDGGDGS